MRRGSSLLETIYLTNWRSKSMTLSDWCAVSKSGGPNHFKCRCHRLCASGGFQRTHRDDQTLVAKIATVAKQIHGSRRKLTKLLDFHHIRWIWSGGFNSFTIKKSDLDPASSRCYAKRRRLNLSIRSSYSFKANFLLLRLVSRRRTEMIHSSRLPPCFLSGQRCLISSKGEVFSTAKDFG